MRTSTEGLMALIGHEGIVLDPYKDSVGVWTLGVGHTAAAGGINPKTFPRDLTVQDAFDLLNVDIVKYENGVNAAVKVPLKQHEFDALVSFHYNTGAIGKASFVKKLNVGDRAGAIKGIMDWNKPAEIIKRRTAERDLFRDGTYPPPFATVYRAVNGKVQWGKGQRIDLRQALHGKPVEPVQPASAPQAVPAPQTAPTATPAPSGGLASIILAILSVFRRQP